ncbi:meiotic recombination protein REC8 homolog [Leptodactylus fuscus]|uniref:meiotic recombination protein REC8 homolog n=1 Tax=Leptodactylus fuscus TaxID=238119 RepID=UPI003F4EF256
MFYYPNVLQPHTGCFSTVWLAATKGSRIVKREYLKVNVINTCQKIVQYILQQVPPPYHGSPVPRLSLYLSAQLSYGVVCVYHRQCDLLIEEMRITLERLSKAEKQAKIDLQQTEQPLLLPDNLMLMKMLEDAPDPFFGMMEIPPELPEPAMIPQLRVLLETSGPEIVRLEKTPPRRRRASRREDPALLTSPETITMKEIEPVPLPSEEFGQDLPEVSTHDWELLMSDLPPLPEVETLPEPRKRRLPGKLDTRELLKDTKEVRPKIPKTDREPVSRAEDEIQQHLEETAIQSEIIRRELHSMEKEIELLKEEKRQAELRRQSERERAKKEEIEREKKYQQEIDREMEHLQTAILELRRLQFAGAAKELLMEKGEEIKQLQKLQEDMQRQWKAEKIAQQLKEKEKEREHLKEREQVKQKLREAELEIERLKKALMEKQLAEKGAESDKEIRKKDEQIDDIPKSDDEVLTVRSSPTLGPPSDILSELDATAILDEIADEPLDFFPEEAIDIQFPVAAASPEVSPAPSSPQLMLPEVTLEAGYKPPMKRSERRATLIVDKETQIESKVMQEQTSDPLIYTQPVAPVTIPHMKFQTPSILFESPTYQKFMAAELGELWSRCAFLEPLQYIKEREEEFISELEQMREDTESGVSIMMSSEFSLEVSEEERSRPILLSPEEGRSISGQEDRILPVVSEMPELIVELPETEELSLGDLQRKLYSDIDSVGYSEFLSLSPHSCSRLLVSRFFFCCLVLSTQEVINLQQTEPYGRITITPGRQYS